MKIFQDSSEIIIDRKWDIDIRMNEFSRKRKRRDETLKSFETRVINRKINRDDFFFHQVICALEISVYQT